MDIKKTLWLGGVLAVLLGVAVVFGAFKPQAPAAPQGETAQTTSYSNQAFNIAFDYSNQYVLQERTETFEGNPLLVVTLIDKNVVVADMSEGPTAISMVVAQNASSTGLEEWVTTHSISNFALSPDGAFATTTFAGNPAMLYRFSGLYENDAVAISHGGRVYLFAVSWMEEEQPIRNDFQHVLESATFI